MIARASLSAVFVATVMTAPRQHLTAEQIAATDARVEAWKPTPPGPPPKP